MYIQPNQGLPLQISWKGKGKPAMLFCTRHLSILSMGLKWKNSKMKNTSQQRKGSQQIWHFALFWDFSILCVSTYLSKGIEQNLGLECLLCNFTYVLPKLEYYFKKTEYIIFYNFVSFQDLDQKWPCYAVPATKFSLILGIYSFMYKNHIPFTFTKSPILILFQWAMWFRG